MLDFIFTAPRIGLLLAFHLPLCGPDRGLHATLNLQLLQDALHVVPGRVVADPEHPSDFVVQHSEREQMQNFAFSIR